MGRMVNERWRFGIILVLALSPSLDAHAQHLEERAGSGALEEPSALGAELTAELDSYIRGALETFDVPGAAVALLDGGKVAYRGAFGARGAGHGGAVDARTLFMIGSITKSMTSTMIASLVDDGIVGWDAPVESLLPSFALAEPSLESQVTLRHLLSHQSGVARWDVSLFFGPEGPLEVIDEVGSIPMHSAPGVGFEYQNQAYALAGFAAARASGARASNAGLYRGYERLMERRVFEPVGMKRTTIDFDRALRAENHAWPSEYSPLARAVQPVQPGFERFATSVAPAGAVWSSIDDMARYALLHLNGGRNVRGQRVVSEAALATTHTPVVEAGGGAHYGLGWFVSESPLGRIVTHSGGTAGFGADLVLVPELGWGVVVLTNRASSGAFVQAVERYILDVLLGRERSPDDDLLALELARRADLETLMALTAPATAEDVAGVVGTYERDVRFFRRGPDLVLRNEFGELILRAVPSYPGAFLVVGNTLGGAVAQFVADADGDVSVTVGLPVVEGEDVQLVQPITLAKVQRKRHPHRPPRWTEDGRTEWHRAVRYLRACGLKGPTASPFR